MRTPWRSTGRPTAPAAPPAPLALLQLAVTLAGQPGGAAEDLDPVTTALARACPDLVLPGLDPLVDTALAGPYARGWQPADLVHVVSRRISRRAARLLGAAVVAEAARSRAADRAPLAWVDQLTALDAAHDVAGDAAGDRPVGVAAWRAAGRVDAATCWRDLARVLALLADLPALEHLLPGPTGWPEHRRAGAVDRTGPVDAKVLGRVRGLLAKAERTEFAEEADALTGKAQELMSRYAIDSALLAGHEVTDQGPGVVARRLHLTDPFAGAKAALLHAVAAANGCQVVLLRDLGIATVVGLPVDLELVDLLFTSLLLQATRALATSTRGGPSSAVFGRGFLLAYAARIGERLAEAGRRAATEAAGEHGGSVLPVLARREAVVAERVAELFPRLRSTRRRTVDPEGWWAGRRAADGADLGAGHTPLRDGGPPGSPFV
jgi:hypothetical protein